MRETVNHIEPSSTLFNPLFCYQRQHTTPMIPVFGACQQIVQMTDQSKSW